MPSASPPCVLRAPSASAQRVPATRRMSRYENPLLVDLTPDQRAAELRHLMDPGFVHRRKILAVLAGTQEAAWINEQSTTFAHHPAADLVIDQCYTSALLRWCGRQNVAPLRHRVLSDSEHSIVCSTERVGPCPGVWDEARGRNEIIIPGTDRGACLEYSTEHIKSTTVKSWLAQGDYELSIVALVSQAQGADLIFEPLLMGGLRCFCRSQAKRGTRLSSEFGAMARSSVSIAWRMLTNSAR